MFGHLKGLIKASEMLDLNVRAAVGSRIYCEMQESENQREMRESLLLITLGENQVVTPKMQVRLKKWMIQIMQLHQPSCR